MKKMEKLIVYTDGGARGNPGPSAIGVVIQNEKGETLKKYAEVIGEGTNNEAEYAAVLFALKKLKHLFGKTKTIQMSVEMRMDSELVASQLSGKYKVENKNLHEPFIKIWNVRMDFENLVFMHVPRSENKEAERLLNEALDGKKQRSLL